MFLRVSDNLQSTIGVAYLDSERFESFCCDPVLVVVTTDPFRPFGPGPRLLLGRSTGVTPHFSANFRSEILARSLRQRAKEWRGRREQGGAAVVAGATSDVLRGGSVRFGERDPRTSLPELEMRMLSGLQRALRGKDKKDERDDSAPVLKTPRHKSFYFIEKYCCKHSVWLSD